MMSIGMDRQLVLPRSMARGNTSRHEVRAGSARLFTTKAEMPALRLVPMGNAVLLHRCRPKYRLIADSNPQRKMQLRDVRVS
jgi:hypothetical protein